METQHDAGKDTMTRDPKKDNAISMSIWRTAKKNTDEGEPVKEAIGSNAGWASLATKSGIDHNNAMRGKHLKCIMRVRASRNVVQSQVNALNAQANR
eukprot:12904132-Prorocentrum_lima.AAC.1